MANKITFAGPFFTYDPTVTFRKNVRKMMDGIANEGSAYAVGLYRAGEGGRQPIRAVSSNARVSAFIVGRTSSLGGKRWAVSAKVSPVPGASAGDAIAIMAAASVIEGRLHIMRRTAAWMRKARAINVTELLKGIA